MSEQLKTSLSISPESAVPKVQDQNVSQGIENHGNQEWQRFGEQLMANHMPEYDGQVGAAQDFVKNRLGMVDAQDTDTVAVLPPKVAEQWGSGTVGGQYVSEIGVTYVFEVNDPARPKTSKLQMASSLVHEIAHSASLTTETANTEHAFFYEGIAGLAEYFALQDFAMAGEYDVPPDCTITRNIDGEDVTIVIPGSFRRVDAAETIEGKADSSQALIAAMVIGMGLQKTGQKASEILAATRQDGTTTYDLLKAVVESIEPGFVDFINAQPKTTDGIIKIARRAQEIVGWKP